MTTVAFDGNMLAVDSLVTEKGRNIGRTDKIIKLDEVLMIVVGEAGTSHYFKTQFWAAKNLEWAMSRVGKIDPLQLKSSRILLFQDNRILEIYAEKDGPACGYIHEQPCSFGSGKEFAQGVLSLGMTADYAVAAGILSSTTSGGHIYTAQCVDGGFTRDVIDLRDLIMPHRFGELTNETFTSFRPVNL